MMFIILCACSVVIVILTAIAYPKTSDFDNITPTILYLAGIIIGIGIPLGFKKKKEIITKWVYCLLNVIIVKKYLDMILTLNVVFVIQRYIQITAFNAITNTITGSYH